LFSKVTVKINGIDCTGDADNFPLRSYSMNLLSHSEDVKRNLLRTSGWYSDSANHFDKNANNAGFMERRKWFGTQTGEATTAKPCGTFEFHGRGIPFIGPLLTDFCSLDTG
jgi:hypothetical protein